MNKKNMISTLAIASLIAIPFFSSNALALSDQNISNTVSISDSATTGTLSIDLSPGVMMSYDTNPNAFALATTNVNAQSDFRMVYGIESTESGYYQTANPDADDAGTVNTGDFQPGAAGTDDYDGTNPFGDWTYMGNASS
ncbi:hypothetical protein [Desulfogranum marinum]|uniref:hypothetical protein n=1 Tax=Desulfogranum marinum TaxID=453220 RepID=UPI001964B3EB|nr:hypothetical protein [Desulfogranum marinum]MBM9513573.1 hypothetical protein [Desulfogranum marinum]